MKKFTILCLSVVVLLMACSSDNGKNNDNIQIDTVPVSDGTVDNDLQTETVSFQARILENDAILMVEPLESESESRSADKIMLSLKNSELVDSEGKKVERTHFEEGLIVEITYDGIIMESYPAQISNVEQVKIIE